MSAKIARLALVLGLATLSVGGFRIIYPSDSQEIDMRPLVLDPDNRARRQVGALEFMAAWELRSRHENFGGISGLVALADGRFVAIGDAGTFVNFALPHGRRKDWSSIAPLPNLAGPNISYRDRDSEGITFDPDSKQYWVSFEANHAIRRYSASFERETGIVRPKEMRGWTRNKGAECIIRLKDGRFIIIGESVDNETHPALLFSGDPVEPASNIMPFRFRPPPGYRVTDCVQLPDGRIAMVNRAVGFPQGFSAKISLMNSVSVGRDATISATVIASLARPLLVDNLEGIAVTREAEDTFLWLISDNNFSIFQRTILMKFRL
ncbi:esterase-like activity of phytase family protein [Sphingorhabdus sp.]|uniref:esterase-like activity of phytase family protein n=1 Tax=Sphingorhabdus sp. TaxID=1902408 RepID=UPI00391AC0D3